MMAEHGLQVLVTFPDGVPLAAQGPALLAFEKHLRATVPLDVRVVKALKGDDSRLRVMMTVEKRNAL